VENKPILLKECDTLARLMEAYVNDSIMLSDAEKKVFEQLCEADLLQKDYAYPSPESRAKELQKRLNVSLSTARKRLRQAADFFNAVEIIDPVTGARVLLHQIDKFLSMCEIIHDFKEAAAFMKLKVQVYAELVVQKPLDAKLFQQNNYTFIQNNDVKINPTELQDALRKWKVGAKEQQRIMEEIKPAVEIT
jgi:5-bromo-4-chloroindolyl phosphate hydrolysis protein